jgi:hypothetical protein
MIVEKKCPVIERYETNHNLDLALLRKKGNSKNLRGVLIQKMKEARQEGNFDVVELLQWVYKENERFQISERIRFESWRGKSSKIRIIKKPDSFIVEFPDRRDKDQEPKIVTKEYSHEEVNEMITAINKLKETYEKIPSRKLGEEFYKKDWDTEIFCNRPLHIRYTHLVNILDFIGIVHYYRSGKVQVLKNVREIQEVLK